MENVSKLSLTSAATVVRVCICGIVKGLGGGGGEGGCQGVSKFNMLYAEIQNILSKQVM